MSRDQLDIPLKDQLDIQLGLLLVGGTSWISDQAPVGHRGRLTWNRLVHKQWPGTQPIEVRSSLFGHQNETTYSREHRQGISDRM